MTTTFQPFGLDGPDCGPANGNSTDDLTDEERAQWAAWLTKNRDELADRLAAVVEAAP